MEKPFAQDLVHHVESSMAEEIAHCRACFKSPNRVHFVPPKDPLSRHPLS
jgi:hypothetical protein